MKNWKILITFVSLLPLILGNFYSATAQDNLTQQAYAIFERNCLNCHGEHGAFTEEIIIDHTALIETGAVVPGKPIESELYKRLLTNDPAKRMPLGQPKLPDAAIRTIGNWIQAGAPSWESQSETAGPFITPKEMLETIEKHLNSLSPFARPFGRYFTLTHLYNAGETTEALHAYQRALSKLVNSLSWGRTIKIPQPIDSEETIFYIDLRDYEWEIGANRWTLIEAEYPYEIEFNAPTQTVLREKLTNLREAMECEVPFVHVDWFLATASLPPLYHDILGLPETDRELEARLEVNVIENIRNAAGKRVWRAGFNNSGVSNHNRVVERHDSRYGAYWKSYDFAGSKGTQNVLTHPLSFTHDGGEIIFNLPNGLQAYLLVDAGGRRLDEAPIDIVSNPAASDPTVRNGLSCIGCHTEGMKDFEDQVRDVVQKTPNPPFNKDRALQLYTDKGTMDTLVAEDTTRYKQALETAGGVFGGIEPVQRFHEAFQRPVDAAYTAAAVGLKTEPFLKKIRANASLQNLGLLVLENDTMKRDTWTNQFSEVVFALDFPAKSAVTPVDPQAERIPGASVYIPDPNLYAAIAKALGKTPRAVITTEDMETLVSLKAADRGIRDLTGLETAKHLEELELQNNPISDLSPLAGLTKLKGINLRNSSISDLSPLAELITLKEVRFSSKAIVDLSPLAGLVNLEGIGAWNTSISDVSPLTGLTQLQWLELQGSPISDFSPLAKLTNLRKLKMYAAKTSDLSPLKGLTGLKTLTIGVSKISDVSSLAGLINLEVLALFGSGRISDISPLASLKNLKVLDLHTNSISDVSPLAGLRNLEELYLHRNNISDISPLDGLRENTQLVWFGNPGFSQGGPKIEGPWLWMFVQGAYLPNSIDYLSQASDGAVTELEVATHGATEGHRVGEHVWTSYKISPAPTVRPDVNALLSDIGISKDHKRRDGIYGALVLNSPREQQTRMFAGSNHRHKVWLNGEFIHENLGLWAADYQDYFPVTLKQGINVLLVAVDFNGDGWGAYFGFDADTEYTVVSPGTGFTFSTDATSVRVGNTFTLRINAEKVTDLSGWQFDLTFDPDVLEAVKVNEGDFLKKGGGTTFFQRGTVNNATGKISGISAALISDSGVTGTGTLLSVIFKAKTDGNSQMALHNFQLGSSTGETIPADVNDFTITVISKPKWDVNADGQVSVLDLILVARHFGEKASANSKIDVNNDGIISILDLIAVAQHMGESTASASPSTLAMNSMDELNPMMIQAWIEQAHVEDDGSIAFREGIAFLQGLLAMLIPDETALLPNYPNPFNPETWIPYHLANPSEVTITIYDMRGTIVRQLDLGHQPQGYYTSQSRAAYWDGRNTVGERVASGIYFYTLTAGDFTATRKLLIRK